MHINFCVCEQSVISNLTRFKSRLHCWSKILLSMSRALSLSVLFYEAIVCFFTSIVRMLTADTETFVHFFSSLALLTFNFLFISSAHDDNTLKVFFQFLSDAQRVRLSFPLLARLISRYDRCWIFYLIN